ncbi:9559_t:CDS:2, partial [Acaulospora colombiana]
MPGSPNNKRLKVSFAKTSAYTASLSPLTTLLTFLNDRELYELVGSVGQADLRRTITPHPNLSPPQPTDHRHPRLDRPSTSQNIPALWRQGPLEQFVMERLSDEELEYWSPGGEGIEKVWEAVVKIIEDECVMRSPISTFIDLVSPFPHNHPAFLAEQNSSRKRR